MLSPLKIALTLSLILASFETAIAAGICTPLQEANLTEQYTNCVKLFKSGKIPKRSENAFRYTIDYWVKNMKGLQDPSCAINGNDSNDNCANCKNPEWIKKGIANDCSFTINDMQSPWLVKVRNKSKHSKAKWRQDSNRTTGYFVDLCAKKSSDLIAKFYINGAHDPKYSDKPGDDGSNKSSLAGAFLLDETIKYDFHPFSETSAVKYRKLAKQIAKEVPPGANVDEYGRPASGIPVIRMVGLNTSNNTTESTKPFHVSAVSRGYGCAGVSPNTHKIMKKMVAHGSSLYMAYGGKKFEQQANNSCVNDSSDGYAPSNGNQTAPVSTER